MPTQTSITSIILLTGLFACSGPSDTVSSKGYGGVRIGSTVSDATTESGMELSSVTPIPENELECFYVYPHGDLGPVSFMVVDGRIARVDIDGPKIVTVAGVGVGNTEEEVLKAYPDQVDVSTHPYAGPGGKGHNLTVNYDGGFGVVFETDGETVERYRAGSEPAISWIEGCS